MTQEQTTTEIQKKLTPEEIAVFREQQKLIEQQRLEIRNIRMDAHATQTLSKMGLPTEYKQFILADTEQDVTDRVNKLVQLINLEADKKANERMKSRYSTSSFGATATTVNPFAKETFNMTEQAKLFRENPEEARRLAALAGVKIN